jgi:hypothetical protein
MGTPFINPETRFEVVMGIYLNTIRNNEKDEHGEAVYSEEDKDRAQERAMALAKAVDGLKALEKYTDTDKGMRKLCKAVWDLQ